MCKRLILVISIILLLFGAATVGAPTSYREWVGTDTNHRWDDANNWEDELEPATWPASAPGPGCCVNLRHGAYADYADYAEIDAVYCSDVNVDEVHFGYKTAAITTLEYGQDDGMLKVTGGRIITTAKFGYRLGYSSLGDACYRNKMLVEGGEVHALKDTSFGIRVGHIRAHDGVYEQTGGYVKVPRLTLDTKSGGKTTGNMAYLSGGTLELTASTTVPLHPNISVLFARPSEYGSHLQMSGGTLIFSHADATIAFVQQMITDGFLASPWPGWEIWTIDDTSGDVVVTVDLNNVRPVADAGGNQAVVEGDTVCLDGSGSYDDNGDELSYSWSIVSKPADSNAVISDSNAIAPCLIADVPGSYVISLVVNDGFEDSEPDNISVMAISNEDAAFLELIDAVDAINELDPVSFKNKNMGKTLTNKINAALELIDLGYYYDALSKLENDILKKMNGCAETGTPDKNDWIKTCEAQEQVYPFILQAIQYLEQTM